MANRLLKYWGAEGSQHREQAGSSRTRTGMSARPLRNYKIRPETLLIARGSFKPDYHQVCAGRMVSASLPRQYISLPQHVVLHSNAFFTMSLQPCPLADGAIAKIPSSLAGAKGSDRAGEKEETQKPRADRVYPGPELTHLLHTLSTLIQSSKADCGLCLPRAMCWLLRQKLYFS